MTFHPGFFGLVDQAVDVTSREHFAENDQNVLVADSPKPD
jgi:hypothetical protein